MKWLPLHPDYWRAPLEYVKDRSLFRARWTCLAFFICHLPYFALWSYAYPQPYESLAVRLIATFVALGVFLLSYRLNVGDRYFEYAYSAAIFFGTIFPATWMFVGNNGNHVWLASYCVLTFIYFALTDWRLGAMGIVVALASTLLLFPLLSPEVWATVSVDRFTPETLLVVAFTLSFVVFSHFMDLDVRSVQLAGQRKTLAIAAHEIRTPLSSIGLLNEAIASKAIDPNNGLSLADARSTLEDIGGLSDEIGSNMAIATDILRSHLLNANPDAPFRSRERVSIASSMDQVVSRFCLGDRSRCDAVKVSVVSDFAVGADPAVMQQVLRNLLENAHVAVVKRSGFSEPGSINVQVLNHSTYGTITITDTGLGISDSDKRRIFDAYFTTSENMGHGLGLTFVKAAVSAYNGKIEVFSTVGRGTTFMLTFPIYKAV